MFSKSAQPLEGSRSETAFGLLAQRLRSAEPSRCSADSIWRAVDPRGSDSRSVFDTMIRQAGCHFIWMSGSISRRGYGRTLAKAVERALGRVLKATPRQTNAAEFDSVRVVKYLGFHVANVTVHRRRIQQHSQLEAGEKAHSEALHAT